MQDTIGVTRFGLFLHQVFGIAVKIGPGGGIKRNHPKFIGGHFIKHMGGEIGVCIGDQGIAFFHQPRQIFVRCADDTAEHPHGQLARDFIGGIKGALGQNIVENVCANGANVIFKRGHDGFGKRLRHLDAGLQMLGRIGFLKSAAGEVFGVGLILHPNALGRGKQVGLAVQFQNIGVVRDRPKTFASVPVCPTDRVITAQAQKRIVRRAGEEGIMAGKIGVTIIGRVPDGHRGLPLLCGTL